MKWTSMNSKTQEYLAAMMDVDSQIAELEKCKESEVSTRVEALMFIRGELRDQVLLLNLPVVHAVARRLGWGKWWFDDAVNVGVIALMDALQSYDPNRGAQFTSFAYRIVQQRIWDDCCRPGGANDRRLVGTVTEFADDSDHLPDSLQTTQNTDRWLDAETALRLVSQTLPEIEAVVLTSRYGLNGEPALTLQQTGKLIRKSHESVRRIEQRAMATLRSYLKVS